MPKVTYDKEEFKRLTDSTDEELCLTDDTKALASSNGIIWLSIPSKRLLFHEILHIIGWNLKAPLFYQKMIHLSGI